MTQGINHESIRELDKNHVRLEMLFDQTERKLKRRPIAEIVEIAAKANQKGWAFTEKTVEEHDRQLAADIEYLTVYGTRIRRR